MTTTPSPREDDVSPAAIKMARARAAITPGTKRAEAARGRMRTASLPPLVIEPDVPIEEQAVLVSVAAELVGVSQQSVQKSIAEDFLPAFQYEGVRYVRLDALVETQAARRQQDAIHELDMRRASHQINVDNLISSQPIEDQCRGAYETCEVCNLDLHAQWDRLGDEPAPVPIRKPASPARLAGLTKARAALAAKRAAG